jgi:hypothetical protein
MAERGPSHIDRRSQDGGPETAASTARGDDGAGSASSAVGSDEEISLPGCNAPALPNALIHPSAWKGCSTQFGCPVRLLGFLH